MASDPPVVDHLLTGAAISGAVAIFGGIWAFVRWVFGFSASRRDSYYRKNQEWDAKLTAREMKLEDEVKARLDVMETRCVNLEHKVQSLQQQEERFRMAVILLADEVHSLNPTSNSLARARAILAEAFPIDFSIPPCMESKLRDLDEKTE